MQSANQTYIYGMNPCHEALRARKRPIHELYVDEKLAGQSRLKPLLRAAGKAGVRITHIPKGELFEICRSKEHQGVVMITEPYPYTKLDDAVYEQPRLLLIDNVEDPRNTGAILRNAQVFGFNTVLMPLKGVPEIYASVIKTSAGATEHLNIVRAANANRYVTTAKARGYRIIALDAGGDTTLKELPVDDRKPLMLVIGGEDKGVGQFILREADQITTIPQKGQINSLNASVAAGIAMYHFSDSAVIS